MSRITRKRQEKKDISYSATDSISKASNKYSNMNETGKRRSEETVASTIKDIDKDLHESNKVYDNVKSDDFYIENTIINDSMRYVDKMKTADKIISVEDEKMYFERKKKRIEMGMSAKENVLTVADILTAEDEGKTEQKEVKLEVNVNESEENINKKKRLIIEQASFEDVVKVAESRKQAELEKDRIRQEELKKQEQLLKEREARKIEEIQKQQELAKNKNEKEEAREKIESREKAESKKNVKVKEKIKTKDKSNEKEQKKHVIDKDDDSMSDINMKLKETEEHVKSNYGKPKKKGGKFKKFILFILFLFVIVYAAGCFVFKDRFFFNTTVNGIDASFKTPAQISDIARDRINGYSLTISGRHDVKDTISGSDVDLSIDTYTGAQKLKQEQGYLGWPIAFIQGQDFHGRLNISLNQDKLNEAIKNFNIFKKENIVEPVSAYPEYDETKKEYVINKGNIGSTPIEDNVKEFVKKEMIAETTDTKYPDSVYKEQKNKPNDERITKAIEDLTKYKDLKIEYVFGKEKEVIGFNDVNKVFDIDSENDYSIKVNRDKVREIVRGLSKKYSTYGDPREIISASTGQKMKVTGGSYGWLINREKETDELKKLIEANKNVSNREPIYAQTAVSRENGDLGNEFIEIDLTKQHMWFVKDGKVEVSTPIVSGNPNKGDATPPGIYPINYKQRKAVLRGPGYASPVEYWIPFNGGVGIHDSSWQPAYGGKRYLFAGSHGCINTPLEKMKEIYKLSKEGMPVIVHY